MRLRRHPGIQRPLPRLHGGSSTRSSVQSVRQRGAGHRMARETMNANTWACPTCNRRFTRKNQRHACGTGDRADVLRNRPPEIVKLYGALERFARSLGPVELVTRERYVLFRSNRIFADAVIMSGAIRLAIHLPRKAEHKLFMKIVSDRRHVTHIAKLLAMEELESLKPFLRGAYEYSIFKNSA
jgi:predicted transport protein